VGELTKGTKVKGHIGTEFLPGTHTVWSFKHKKWVHTAKLNRPAWLAFGGWCGTIPKTSTNPNLAFKLLSLIASPAFSLKMVTGAATGMNPYRYSHFSHVAAWKHAGYPEPDLNMYLAAMKKSDLDPHAVQDLRMPGAATFQDDTEIGTGAAVSGQASAKAALNGVASKWNAYNNKVGRAKQLAAYRASLNIGATG
jgi:multiple sugar transport system substrate-binding protein